MEQFPTGEQKKKKKNHSNLSVLEVLATLIGSHLSREPTAVLTKRWNWELTLATNFGSHAQMVTKFGGQILATKFGFIPDWLISPEIWCHQ